MESINLVKSGIDLVDTLITYLAKDAIGGEFLKNYLESRSTQETAAKKQRAAMDNLMAGTEEMEKFAQKIAENANANIQRLSGISQAIKALKDSVNAIEAEQKRYADQFKNLISQAKTISNQINDIQNISQQTNLLSFNASIEAARAGTAGKGFRVIANEVKKLSGDTNKTSEEIKHNVEKLVNSITDLEKTTKSNTQGLRDLAEETDATMQQFDTVRQINSSNNASVGDISRLVNRNGDEINTVLRSIKEMEDNNIQSINLFADCASKNEMLFNDLYSFVYELKAVFKDLQNV
ncbi:MAG: hypothetical protein KBT11_08075 [Treponema sp.]|nr:hypothetical protein [Candidatus Treponema equifaecale]